MQLHPPTSQTAVHVSLDDHAPVVANVVSSAKGRMLSEAASAHVGGGADFRFLGFVPRGQDVPVPVGHAMTFVCPAGTVFLQNRFLTPRITYTCKVSGGLFFVVCKSC